MDTRDALAFAARSLVAARVRTGLTLLAMGIGVAAVVLLTALGEGARRYVVGQFASLGTHLLIVLPGRSETTGGHPPLLGETPRDLTLDDALALLRSPHVRRVAPLTLGSAPVSAKGRERESTVVGSTADFFAVRHLELALGRPLPAGDPRAANPACVIGAKIQRELFGAEPPVGRWLRVGDWRCRVTGVLASEGRSIGLDLQEIVVIPVASAQALFNTPSLFRVLVDARSREDIGAAGDDVRRLLAERHEGEEDVTVITQDAVVATFDRIFRALTLAVGGIAAVSLGVAGILIMNVMVVSVSQRRAEIGLLKAVGATSRQVQRLFLLEAGLVASLGAVAGVSVGLMGAAVLRRLYPTLDLVPPVWAVAAGFGVAIATGLLFGVLPARRAARLDPVQALARR
jgi:putative ABC transport system permease protein